MEYVLMKEVHLIKEIINNGKNVIIFGVHENSLTHATNKANNIYIYMQS